MSSSCYKLVVCLCVAGAAWGQTSAGNGAISGTVTDPSGAAVSGAQVVIDNQKLGLHRNLKTTGGGVFNAPTLPPNSGYQVSVNAPGFGEFKQENITLLVGQNVNLPVALSVKTKAMQIDVEDVAPIVDNKIDVSQNITQHQIDNLPINGRRVDSFVLLTPGVVPDGTFGLLSFRGIPGGNNFLTDGNDTTDSFYNENAGRTRIPTQISQDAVQEFQVLTDGYTAEYGRALGGVVNTITRSGTNDFHGTAFWYFRNRTLDARDPFSTVNPSEWRHQFGGSLAGRIIKDKLFYFINTEEQRRQFPLVSTITNNPSAVNGNTQTWNGCGVATGGNPAASPAQCAAINGTLKRFFGTIPRTADQDTALGKIDYRLNDLNSLSFDFNYQHFYSPNGIQTGAVVNGGGALNSNGYDDVNVRYGRAAWTYTPTPTIVNEARFGWFKDRQFDAVNTNLLDPVFGPLSVSVNGVGIGGANYLPRIQPSESRYEAADNLSYTVGKHSLKFGVDYFNTEDYTNQLVNGNGSFSYSNVNAFALDYSGNTANGRRYTNYSQAFGNRAVDASYNELSLYAQDQYKVRPNVTLYYGVRYETTFFPKPPLSNPFYPQTGRIPDDKLNFAPRAGFAWSLNGDKTVIRSGYGMFYGRYPGAMTNSLFTTNNLYQQSFTLNNPAQITAAGPVFPALLPAPPPSGAGAAVVGFAANNLRTPYSQQADFGIQQALGKNTSITLSYLWSNAIELLSVRDLNLPTLPNHTVTYNVLNSSNALVGSFVSPVYLASDIIDKRFARILQVENGGQSSYNALALQIQRRLTHGLEGSLSYTWSHAIDYNLGGAGNNLFFGNNAPSNLYNGNYRADRGDGALDQRQRLVINWVYSPTFTGSNSVLAKFLINNWQLADITTIATGQPATASVAVTSALSATQLMQAGLGRGQSLAYPGSSPNGFGGSSRVPFLAPDTLRLPDSFRTDVRLTKVLPFSERYRVALNFEVFNLTNTITYTSLNGRQYNLNGFNLTPATGFGQVTASSGFPDGTNARRAQASIRIDF